MSTSRQAGITKVQNNSAFVCYRDFVCAFIPLTLQISRTHFFAWSAKRHILIVCTSRRGIYKNQTCSIGDAHSHRIRCSDVPITISVLRESSAAASPDYRLKNHTPSPPFGVLTVRRSERPPHCQKMVLFILTTSFFQSERVRICTSHGAATIGGTALLVSKAAAHLVRPRCLVLYCLPIPAPLVLSRRRPHADGSGV